MWYIGNWHLPVCPVSHTPAKPHTCQAMAELARRQIAQIQPLQRATRTHRPRPRRPAARPADAQAAQRGRQEGGYSLSAESLPLHACPAKHPCPAKDAVHITCQARATYTASCLSTYLAVLWCTQPSKLGLACQQTQAVIQPVLSTRQWCKMCVGSGLAKHVEALHKHNCRRHLVARKERHWQQGALLIDKKPRGGRSWPAVRRQLRRPWPSSLASRA